MLPIQIVMEFGAVISLFWKQIRKSERQLATFTCSWITAIEQTLAVESVKEQPSSPRVFGHVKSKPSSPNRQRTWSMAFAPLSTPTLSLHHCAQIMALRFARGDSISRAGKTTIAIVLDGKRRPAIPRDVHTRMGGQLTSHAACTSFCALFLRSLAQNADNPRFRSSIL